MMTGNPADAEDLVQSVLAKTYLAWDRIKDRAALDGYVRRTMVNTHISGWRRRRVEEYPTDEIPGPGRLGRPGEEHGFRGHGQAARRRRARHARPGGQRP